MLLSSHGGSGGWGDLPLALYLLLYCAGPWVVDRPMYGYCNGLA